MPHKEFHSQANIFRNGWDLVYPKCFAHSSLVIVLAQVLVDRVFNILKEEKLR